MPRQAHGRPVQSATASKRQKKRQNVRNRGLNALETAEKQYPTIAKVPQHRLGRAEDDDDRPNTRADGDERSAKRRKVENVGGDEDVSEMDEGSDLEGNEGAWHVGMEEDDDDSDIDSDEAFGESDEEKFADFTFRGSEGGKKRRAGDEDEDDESEEGDEDDESLGEDAVDLATAWDMDDKDIQEEEAKKNKSKKRPTRDIQSDSSEDSLESDADDESDAFSNLEQFSAEDEDEDDPEASTRLRSFVDSLTPAERAADASSRRRDRISQALPDKPTAHGLKPSALSAADLMQYITDPSQRKSLKILQEAAAEPVTGIKNGSTIPGKLSVPLAKRQQDRLDRAAAYDVSKKTMDRWLETVKQQRRAEHISFPAVDHAKQSATAVKNFQPISKVEPTTDLENKIREIIEENGGQLPSRAEANGADGSDGHEDDEDDLADHDGEFDQLPTNSTTLDDVKARQQARRLQREMMFREDLRSKRIKKIKSKAYRRIRRKEAEKLEIRNREAGLVDIDSEEERERNDRVRAEERMGARHRESKWAKGVKEAGMSKWSEDVRGGVGEMARRDEELRRKVQGRDVAGSDEESESNSDSAESADEQGRWNEKLDRLRSGADADQETSGGSKLANMAFMKRADAARRAENDEELRQVRRSLRQDGEEDSDESDSEEEGPVRQSFGSSKQKKPTKPPKVIRNEFESKLSDDEEEAEVDNEPPAAVAVAPQAKASQGSSSAPKLPAPSSKPSTNIAGSMPITNGTTQGSNARPTSSKALIKNPSQSALDDEYTSPSESEAEADQTDMTTQMGLDIFAGEDEKEMLKEFAKEKAQTTIDEGDQVEDLSLPGWGSWTGAGMSRASKAAAAKNKKRFLTTTVKGVAPESRLDAKLDRVIVNEKRNRKNAKYLAGELPFPYENRAQYERALRLPMGPEWSTRERFQDAIKPRVLVKQGQVIKAVSKPLR